MWNVLFYVTAQLVVVISYWCFRTTYQSHAQSFWDSWTLRTGPIVVLKSRLRNHHYSHNTKRQFSFLFPVTVITSCLTHHVPISNTWISSLSVPCKSLCSTCGSCCFHDKTTVTGLTQMMLVMILSVQWLDYGSNNTESLFNSQHGQKFFFPKMSRTGLGTTQPTVQWVLEALLLK